MNIEKSKMITLWALNFLSILFLIFYIDGSIETPNLDIENLNAQQQELLEDYRVISTNNSRAVKTALQDDGQRIFLYPDGHYTAELPPGFENDDLTQNQIKQLENLSTVQSPFWFSWIRKSISIQELKANTSTMVAYMIAGIISSVLYIVYLPGEEKNRPLVAAWIFGICFSSAMGVLLFFSPVPDLGQGYKVKVALISSMVLLYFHMLYSVTFLVTVRYALLKKKRVR